MSGKCWAGAGHMAGSQYRSHAVQTRWHPHVIRHCTLNVRSGVAIIIPLSQTKKAKLQSRKAAESKFTHILQSQSLELLNTITPWWLLYTFKISNEGSTGTAMRSQCKEFVFFSTYPMWLGFFSDSAVSLDKQFLPQAALLSDNSGSFQVASKGHLITVRARSSSDGTGVGTYRTKRGKYTF